MSQPTTLHVLRVFVDDAGRHGNPLGVFLDGRAVSPVARQAVAAALGYSETVFVDDLETGELRIFTPAVELPLAGHPLVGTAWLLGRTGATLDALHPPAGRVPIAQDAEGRSWITADPETAPPWRLHELPDPRAVEALRGDPGDGMTCAWAWQDRARGVVRARVFAPAVGVPEDPATGSAALRLAAALGADLDVTQGDGSRITARLVAGGLVRIGGRCVLDDTRPFAVPPGPAGEPRLVAVDVEHPDARRLVAAYVAELRQRMSAFEPPPDEQLRADAARGVVLVAYDGDVPVACGSLRALDERTAEVKRMFVSREVRGRGLGRRLLHALEARARAAGHRRVVLDTAAPLDEAARLYQAEGYVEIPRYNDNPHATRWFEKPIG